MTVQWIRCGPYWCDFRLVDLSNSYYGGVYVIWSSWRAVYVGSGIIAARLAEHRGDARIIRFPNLLVTWASVPAVQQEGVERYLADWYRPLVGDRHPAVPPVEVNVPW